MVFSGSDEAGLEIRGRHVLFTASPTPPHPEDDYRHLASAASWLSPCTNTHLPVSSIGTQARATLKAVQRGWYDAGKAACQGVNGPTSGSIVSSTRHNNLGKLSTIVDIDGTLHAVTHFVHLMRAVQAQWQGKVATLCAFLPEGLRGLELEDWLSFLLFYYCSPFLYSQSIVLKPGSLDTIWSGVAKDIAFMLLVVCPLSYYLLSRYNLLETLLLVADNESCHPSSSHNEQDTPCEDVPDEAADIASGQSRQAKEHQYRPTNLPAELPGTSIITGLSSRDVRVRKEIFGERRIEGGTNIVSVYKKVLLQDPSCFVIYGSIMFYLIQSEYVLFLALCCLLFLLVRRPLRHQRYLADLLRWYYQSRASTAFVLRNGELDEISADDLVMGDIVHVSEGNGVPADGSIIWLDGNLTVDQRALAGESLLVDKDVGHTCFETTQVVRGDAFLLIEATGLDTHIGQKILAARGTPELLPSRKRTVQRSSTEYERLTRDIGIMLLLCLLPLAAMFGSESRTPLLAVLTGLLLSTCRNSTSRLATNRAVGSARLAKNGCIVQMRRHASIDALAGASVLLCGKTGIVTENWLTVRDPICLSGHADELMMIACLSTGPSTRSPDAVESGLFRALKRFPQAKANVDRYRIIDTEAFNTRTKRLQSLVESHTGRRTLCSLGAPRAILQLCFGDDRGADSDLASAFREAVSDCVSQGFRTLGVACKYEQGPFRLLGVIPIADPIRLEARDSFAVAQQLGLSIKVTTGDADAIGEAMCAQLGIEQRIFNTEELQPVRDAANNNHGSRIESASVFTVCGPKESLEIQRVLQERGRRVVVTGDGTDHATALDLAECGIAVEGATVAAQAAADMVMIKPGISSLVDTIRSSRQIFQQGHNLEVESLTHVLHIFFAILFCYVRYEEILAVAPVLIWYQTTKTLKTSVTKIDDIPYSLQPMQWSFRKLLSEAIPLSMILLVGTCMTAILCGSEADANLATLLDVKANTQCKDRRQAVLMSLMISECWLSVVINSGGRPWICRGELWQVSMLLSVQLLLTVACLFGIAGDGWQMSATTAYRVWCTSLLSLGTACVVYGLSSRKGRVRALHQVKD